jgi:DNA-binding LacI/PurR family transcriptional regulator
MKKEATIFDVARKAEVSISTVSRVVNHKENVNEDTVRKVNHVIDAMGYHPNVNAMKLSQGYRDVIGVIVSDVRNPFFAHIFVSCEKYADLLGYSLLLCNFLDSEKLESQSYQTLLAQRVAAIIHLGGSADKVRQDPEFVDYAKAVSKRLPVVFSEKLSDTACAYLKLDNNKSTDVLIEYLLSLGHTRIALVGGRNEVLSTYEKRQRYYQQMRKHGITVDKNLVVDGNTYDEQGGYLAMRDLLKKKLNPTAVISINDFSALGIVRAAQEKSLEIGKDISVASYDDTFIAEAMEPSLTSVSIDYDAYCKELVFLADSLINNEKVSKPKEIPVHLSIRRSCVKIG